MQIPDLYLDLDEALSEADHDATEARAHFWSMSSVLKNVSSSFYSWSRIVRFSMRTISYSIEIFLTSSIRHKQIKLDNLEESNLNNDWNVDGGKYTQNRGVDLRDSHCSSDVHVKVILVSMDDERKFRVHRGLTIFFQKCGHQRPETLT